MNTIQTFKKIHGTKRKCWKVEVKENESQISYTFFYISIFIFLQGIIDLSRIHLSEHETKIPSRDWTFYFLLGLKLLYCDHQSEFRKGLFLFSFSLFNYFFLPHFHYLFAKPPIVCSFINWMTFMILQEFAKKSASEYSRAGREQAVVPVSIILFWIF